MNITEWDEAGAKHKRKSRLELLWSTQTAAKCSQMSQPYQSVALDPFISSQLPFSKCFHGQIRLEHQFMRMARNVPSAMSKHDTHLALYTLAMTSCLQNPREDKQMYICLCPTISSYSTCKSFGASVSLGGEQPDREVCSRSLAFPFFKLG